MDNGNARTGIFYAVFAYVVWGLLPMYWKLVEIVSPGEILASRIIWSFVFMFLLLIFTRRVNKLKAVLKEFKQKPKILFALGSASLIVSFNWFIYIYAVNNDYVVQASLGYYMNPLVSVLLGVIILKEKLSVSQYISFVLAAIGVIILTVSYGSFPWIALSLAITFAVYGLAKKLIPVDSDLGLTLETMFITPLALTYIGYLFITGNNFFLNNSLSIDLLLMGAGIATAVPLLYFAKGARSIPLSTLGFLQYIAPTIMLFLGVFVYQETFTKVDLIAFLFIWVALILYYYSFLRSYKKGLDQVAS